MDEEREGPKPGDQIPLAETLDKVDDFLRIGLAVDNDAVREVLARCMADTTLQPRMYELARHWPAFPQWDREAMLVYRAREVGDNRPYLALVMEQEQQPPDPPSLPIRALDVLHIWIVEQGQTRGVKLPPWVVQYLEENPCDPLADPESGCAAKAHGMTAKNAFDGVWWGIRQVEAWVAKHAPTAGDGAVLVEVKAGRLVAWGKQPDRDQHGSPLSKSAAVLAPIPTEVFGDPVLTINGTIIAPAPGAVAWNEDINRRNAAHYNQTRYRLPWLYPVYIGVTFKAADVVRMWPQIARQQRPTARKLVAPPILEAALRTYCGTLPNGRVKRDDAERHLREATGCSRVAARAAYKQLPASLKLKQGKPAVS